MRDCIAAKKERSDGHRRKPRTPTTSGASGAWTSCLIPCGAALLLWQVERRTETRLMETVLDLSCE